MALSGASRERADAFLRKQERQSDLQIARLEAQDRHFHEKAELELSHLRLRRFSGWAKAIFEASLGLLALAVLCGLGIMVWDAAHADGLVIEEFSVPPDLAAKGMTGQAVASLMLDKLTAMQNATASFRPAKSYSNNWGNDLKVEIPDTGISFGEAYRFLCGWLGHETRISGEVYWTDKNIAINVRASGEQGATVTGSASDLANLIQQAAEKVYSDTQPYRYASYLFRNAAVPGALPRWEEAEAIFNRLTTDPNPLEQAWAWVGLANIHGLFDSNDLAAIAAMRKAIAAYPDLPPAHHGLAAAESELGEVEDALAQDRITQRLLERTSVPDVQSDLVGYLRGEVDNEIANQLGDYRQAAQLAHVAAQMTGNRDPDFLRSREATALAADHDAAAARGYFKDMPPPPSPKDNAFRARSRLQIDFDLEDWPAVMASESSVEKGLAQFYKGSNLNNIIASGPRLWLALAKARVGDIADAERLVAPTKADCYDCTRTRSLIAAAAKQWGRADYWFARAVQQAPSIPFAYNDWGRTLLERGKPDAAIGQFKLSNQKGPHFADPLEGWGEALMQENRSDLALAKFEEANKYAPNWGRLHLKWGEAMMYAGEKSEAKKQFALAASLYLSAADKAVLASTSTRAN